MVGILVWIKSSANFFVFLAKGIVKDIRIGSFTFAYLENTKTEYRVATIFELPSVQSFVK